MAFLLSHFEENFGEPELRRAVRFIQNDQVYAAARIGQSFTYNVARSEVQLRIVRDKVSGCQCSCGKKSCAHLAAALLKITHRGSTAETSLSSGGAGRQTDPFTELFKANKTGEINSSPSRSAKGGLETFLRDFLLLTDEASRTGDAAAGNELQELMIKLDHSFAKGLTKKEQELWYYAGLQLLRNNRLLKAETFYFLLVRLLLLPLTPVKIDRFCELYTKRTYKKPFDQDFNWFGLLGLQIQSRFSVKVIDWDSPSAEELIVKPELLFAQGKTKSALKMLEKKLSGIDQVHAPLKTTLIKYIASAARQYESVALETEALRALLQRSPIIHPAWLPRLKRLMGRSYAEELQRMIERERSGKNIGKLTTLMLESKQYREVFSLLLRSEGRFSVLTEVATLMLPHIDISLLISYALRLGAELQKNGYSTSEELVLSKAADFLQRLDADGRKLVLDKLSELIYPLSPAGRALASLAEQLSLNLPAKR